MSNKVERGGEVQPDGVGKGSNADHARHEQGIPELAGDDPDAIDDDEDPDDEDDDGDEDEDILDDAELEESEKDDEA